MSEQAVTQQNPQPKRKHKFEIQVEEADYERADQNGGKPEWRIVRSDPRLDGGRPNIIEVADKKEFMELQKQYAMCDQRIRIIREIDPFDDPKPTSSKAPTQAPQLAITTSMPNAQYQPAAFPQILSRSDGPQMVAASQPTAKPKIVTIGDIEIKYDGDKIYQKQWMKLTPAEASNFRVVNSSCNKIVSMAGRHIEAKRWVLVEEKTSSQDDDVVENLIEG